MTQPLKMTLHLDEKLRLAGTVAVSGEKPRRAFHYRYVPTSNEDGLALAALRLDKLGRAFMVDLGDEQIRTLLRASEETFAHGGVLQSLDLWLREWTERPDEQSTEPVRCLGELFGMTQTGRTT